MEQSWNITTRVGTCDILRCGTDNLAPAMQGSQCRDVTYLQITSSRLERSSGFETIMKLFVRVPLQIVDLGVMSRLWR